MPDVLRAPQVRGLEIDLDPSDMAVISAVLSVLPSPADRPGQAHVLRVAAQSCGRALAAMDVAAPCLAEIVKSLRHVSDAMPWAGGAQSAALLRGQTSTYPAWAYLASLDPDAPNEVLRLVGAELLTAVTLQRPFRKSIVEMTQNLKLCDPHYGELQKSLSRIGAFTRKLLTDLARMSADGSRTPRELLFEAELRASFFGQLNAYNLDDRLACGSTREFSSGETAAAARGLRGAVEAGDAVALAVVIAFSAGPRVELVLQMPLVGHEGNVWMARIDAVAGVVQIDLSGLLELAAAPPRSQPARPLLVMPLPQFAAKWLREAAAANPSARCLGEVLGVHELSPRAVVPGMPQDSPIRATIARFLRTRATAGIRAGVERGLAAWAFGDFTKVGSSSCHYVTYSLEEVWRAHESRYESLGWGPPARIPNGNGVGVGSMATAEVDLVRQIDAAFVGAVNRGRPGRKYTWRSVVAHHNAFARLCVHRTAFFTSARAALIYAFGADTSVDDANFISLVDKRIGPFGGATPLPNPVRLAQQTRLWHAHVECLGERAQRARPAGWQQILDRVQAVRARREVPLYFTLQDDGSVADAGAADVVLPMFAQMKGDWRRHFVPNQLRSAGVPFSVVSAHLRHHIEGLSCTGLMSPVSVLSATEALAHALDLIAQDLGMQPVPGLRRGKEA